MSEFDPTKPVQTRDGRKARIICTDRNYTPQTIVALYECIDGKEAVACYSKDGTRYSSSDACDLINIPDCCPEHRGKNIFFANTGEFYTHPDAAQQQNTGWPVAKLEITDGVITSAEILP